MEMRNKYIFQVSSLRFARFIGLVIFIADLHLLL